MTIVVRASAPGKLVLAGEYSVLDGGPALVTAVNRRASATISTPAGSHCELHVANTGSTLQFDCCDDGSLQWLSDPAEDGAALAAAFGALGKAGVRHRPAQSFRIVLDSRSLFAKGPSGGASKLGLGSSAAVCVALTGALLQHLGGAADIAVFLDAHRRLQRGRGSGIDVAGSFHGGVLAFQRMPGRLPDIRSLEWPAGLFALPVWTGHAASTRQLIERRAAFAAAAPGEHERLMAELGAAGALVVSRWETGAVRTLLAAIQDFADHLQALDTAGAIGIWSASHRELRKAATGCGVVYKPSGAGGGDCGIAFSDDAERIAKVGAEFLRLGYAVPDIEFGAPGLEAADVT